MRFKAKAEPEQIDGRIRSEQHRTLAAVFAGIAKIVMIGQRHHAIDKTKVRPVQHFDQAVFAGVIGDIGEALVLFTRLFAQKHGRFFVRHAHAFEQQTLFRQLAKVADGRQRIFQVIEQSKTQNEVEFSQLQNGAILNVRPFERNIRKTLAGLANIFRPSVESADIQSARAKCLRKESHAGSGIERGAKLQERFHAAHHAANGCRRGRESNSDNAADQRASVWRGLACQWQVETMWKRKAGKHRRRAC